MRYRNLLLVTLICLIATPAFAAKTITLVADKWCPYNCEPGSDNPGFLIEIITQAFKKRDIGIEYSVLPWDQAIAAAREGKFNAIVGASPNDAPDFIFPKVSQGWMHTQFFVKKGAMWHFYGKSSLEKVTLGVASGYIYGDTIDDYIRANANDARRIQVASGDNVLADNIDKLLGDKIGAIIEDINVMNYYLAKHGLSDKIEPAGQLPISDQNNIYIAFSPKTPQAKQYARILSEEMQNMRASGELKAILDKYSVQDWQK